MKTTYDIMPALVLREGSITRIFHSFQPITVTNQDETTTVKYEGYNVDIEGASDYVGIVSAVFRDRYPDSNKDAVLMNRQLVRDNPEHEKAEKYIAEYEAMQAFRVTAKQVASQVVEQLMTL